MSFSASIVELVENSQSDLVGIAPWWRRAPLGNVAKILNGFPWKSVHFNDQRGVPVIRIRDVTSGRTATRYDGPLENGYWIEDGELLVGMDGDFNTRVWAGGKALLNQRVCRIGLDKDVYLKAFLALVLPSYLKLINDETHSITVKHLSSSTLADIPIPLPPLAEQQRIVAKISSLSLKSKRASDHLDHIPRLVEKYKQAILAAAFRGDLTLDWRPKNSRGDAHQFVIERLKASEELRHSMGRGRDEKNSQVAFDDELRVEIARKEKSDPLPPNWCWASVGLVFGVYIGSTPSRKEARFWGGKIPWVSSGEVAFCRISRTNETISEIGLEQTSTRLHPKGTVLIGMIGEGKTRGQAAILDIQAANNQNCAAIRVSEAGYSPDYLYWYFWMSYGQTRTVGAGNNQPALNKDRVQRLTLPLAPVDEAFEVAKRIEAAFAWIDRLASETTSARKLIDHLDQAILAKAFRGELVPQDPNDEPASVLLARIKAERSAAPEKKLNRAMDVAAR